MCILVSIFLGLLRWMNLRKHSWEFCPAHLRSDTKTVGIFPAEMLVKGDWELGCVGKELKSFYVNLGNRRKVLVPCLFAVPCHLSVWFPEKLSINAVLMWGGLLLITIYCLSTSMKNLDCQLTKATVDLNLAASKSLVQGRCHGISCFNYKDRLNSWSVFDLTWLMSLLTHPLY